MKEVVSNAETGTINRSIGMIQSHRSRASSWSEKTFDLLVALCRSGACQATISVVKTGMDEVTCRVLMFEIRFIELH